MRIALRPADIGDFDFAFAVKRDAIRSHVEVRWTWDERWQLEHHRKKWESKPWQVLYLEAEPIGTVSIDVQPTHLQFGEFYILAKWRNLGFGTEVMRYALAIGDRERLDTCLEYLKWNPVGSLYKRHGFAIVSESETHYHCEREPNAP